MGFNKKAITGGLAATAALSLAVTTWSSFQHDRKIGADFQKQFNANSSPRLITVSTDGVTRQGFLSKGAAMHNFSIGFYNYPSNALVVAKDPEASCWYTTLRVTEGQENLPFWQKILGGAEYERVFANQAFNGLFTYSCAPLNAEP